MKSLAFSMVVLTSSLVFLFNVACQAQEPPPRQLMQSMSGQLTNAVDELQLKMAADTKLKGRKLKPGKFTSKNLPDSNFELEFESQLRKLLADSLDDKSDYLITGEYNSVPGDALENKGLRVVQLILQVVGPNLQPLQTVIKEVNDSADVARILGVTTSIPDSPKIEERLQKLEEARVHPTFSLREKTQVFSPGLPDFTVEIVRQAGGSRAGKPVVPTDLNGHAFVDLQVGDTFSIVIRNTSPNDVVASVSIDGLDVANEFSEDATHYPGYVISNKGEHAIDGWLRTVKSSQKNVFQFVVNQVGKGAATERKTRGSRGVITVNFLACSTEPNLIRRAFGEVGKGQLMDVGYSVQSLFVNSAPVAVVSIRYNH